MDVTLSPYCRCRLTFTSVFLFGYRHRLWKLRRRWRTCLIETVNYGWCLDSNTSTFFVCTSCQAHFEQPLGKLVTKTSETSGHVNSIFRTQAGPLISDKCTECDSTLHVSGYFSDLIVLTTLCRLLDQCGLVNSMIRTLSEKSLNTWSRAKTNMVLRLEWKGC